MSVLVLILMTKSVHLHLKETMSCYDYSQKVSLIHQQYHFQIQENKQKSILESYWVTLLQGSNPRKWHMQRNGTGNALNSLYKGKKAFSSCIKSYYQRFREQ